MHLKDEPKIIAIFPAHPGNPKQKMSKKIFINYRRDKDSGMAGRLYDRLQGNYGDSSVFMNVDTLKAGDEFRKVINKTISECDFFLAIIGPDWMTAADEEGQIRIQKPDDFVRIEIATALRESVRVIPVLLDKASRPREDELPADLASLVERQSVELRHTRFDDDANGIIDKIGVADEHGPSDSEPEKPKWRASSLPVISIAALALLPAGAAAFIAWQILGIAEPGPGQVVTPPQKPVSPPKRPVCQLAPVLQKPATVTKADMAANLEKLFSQPKETKLFLRTGNVNVVQFSPSGKSIVASGGGPGVQISTWGAGCEPYSLRQKSSGIRSALSSDGSRIATGNSGGQVRLLNTETGRLEHEFKDKHDKAVRAISFAPNGKFFVSGSYDGSVRLWNVDEKIEGSVLASTGGAAIIAVAISPDSQKIAAGGRSGGTYPNKVRLWDSASREELDSDIQTNSDILAIAFSPDGKLIATGDFKQKLIIWDLETGSKKLEESLPSWVTAISFSPDGRYIAAGTRAPGPSASEDGFVWVYDLDAPGQLKRKFRPNGFQSTISSIDFSHDGRFLIAGGWDREEIYLWRAAD